VPLTEGALIEHDGISLPFDLARDGQATLRFAWCAYVAEPVLNVFGKPSRFLYTRHFASVDEVVRFAKEHEQENLRKTALVESLLDPASLSKSQ